MKVEDGYAAAGLIACWDALPVVIAASCGGSKDDYAMLLAALSMI